MEVSFTEYTANYLTVYSQMICSVLSKWQFHFYLSANSDFGFFFLCRLFTPQISHKRCKRPIFEFCWVHEVPTSLRRSVKGFEFECRTWQLNTTYKLKIPNSRALIYWIKPHVCHSIIKSNLFKLAWWK